MSITLTPISPALGAIVGGIDLRQPLDEANRQAIESALLTHQVLFFRAQPIEPQQQASFAACFGDLHIHPIYPNIPEREIVGTGGDLCVGNMQASGTVLLSQAH